MCEDKLNKKDTEGSNNNLWLTLGETNNTACSAVKALSEYNAGA